MRSWSGVSVCNKWSGKLAIAEKDDFTRMILPLMRLFWPSAQQTPNMKSWDAKGIDIIVWKEEGCFPCVIQCKGFQVHELGSSQIHQIKRSIERFLESDVYTDTYLLIHNRDGRYQEFNKRVNEQLQRLISSGKAKKAELWNRQTLLNKSFDQMVQVLNEALKRQSKYLLGHFQDLFEFSRFYIAEVPFIEKELSFKRGEPCSVKLVQPLSSRDICKTLLSPTEARWTLLTGRFGSGKTTAVLHTIASSERVVIFVPCSILPPSSLQSSTNLLLEEIIKSLDILSEFDDQDKEALNEMSGAVMTYLLGNLQSPHILILDGLDENRIYANLEGLQQLSNQLADLSCPIIITTRTEHLNAMFGDFSLAFHEFSSKKSPYRNAQLLELQQWEKEQVVELTNSILRETPEDKRPQLAAFLRLLDNEEYLSLYDKLPHHPLFLQFILEDIIDHDIRRVTRSVLLRSWIERKIRRDRTNWISKSTTKRVSLDDSIDTEDFVARMIVLMENVAFLMIEEVDNIYRLSESIDSRHICSEAEKIFRISSDPILPILLNSVLISQSQRRGMDLKISFALRVFQEYLLAAYIVRENLSDDGFPEAVQSFCSEIGSV